MGLKAEAFRGRIFLGEGAEPSQEGGGGAEPSQEGGVLNLLRGDGN